MSALLLYSYVEALNTYEMVFGGGHLYFEHPSLQNCEK